MRIWLLVLALVFPLQWSTTAVAAYCMHERDAAAAQHFGHHDHKAQAGHSDDGDPDGDGQVFDGDCPSCHAGCLHALFPALNLAAPIEPGVLPPPYLVTAIEGEPDSLLRPPLARAA
ncbi:hypothetical protein GPA19_01500 [Azoarcus indigens]|uniref:Cobalt-zinc-cadmium efflux system protein n=1 Tax=Azoarcus indigens TaxID=29545 RepID=A0A4V6PQS4_9RHOO|nr:DUF2946 family protein [Azoarcus indigens]NMG63627.1 hypothetical protein [Azoarcus indigens]TDN56162.1 hypothetical protein C7389_10297 [Azoarcus indigens]